MKIFSPASVGLFLGNPQSRISQPRKQKIDQSRQQIILYDRTRTNPTVHYQPTRTKA